MATNLQVRAQAVEQTLAAWQDKPFKLGKNDCWKLVIFALKKMRVNIPNTSKALYKTPLAARAALKNIYKVKSTHEFFDKFFPRINVAQCLPGDIISMPGLDEAGLGSFGIYIGNQLVLCYEEEHELPVAGRLTFEKGSEPLAAWRALP